MNLLRSLDRRFVWRSFRFAASAKPNQVGSSRREAKAAAKAPGKASQHAAQGIRHNTAPVLLDPTIHAKKEPAGRNGRKGQVAVGTPNVPGHSANVDAAKYNAMKDILLAVMPRKAPGMTQGEMFDAVREKATNNHFPGSTHRWWAKSVQLDLETKGVLVREPSTPLRWHLR